MYTITRQLQWPDGDKIVEISEGGIDYTNPDALAQKYPNEFEEFEDPREAVTAAIEICQAWRKDGETNASIGIGATGGMTMPFDEISFEDAKNWADEIWKKIEKCPSCDKVMEDAQEWYEAGEFINNDFLPFDDGFKYCSQICAEKDSIFTNECLECGELFDEEELEPHPDEYEEYICNNCLENYNEVENLMELTGQESGIVIYSNQEGLICNWSSINGYPRVDPIGFGVIGLCENIPNVEPEYTEDIGMELADINIIYDINNDLNDLYEWPGSKYILGNDIVIFAPKDWH